MMSYDLLYCNYLQNVCLISLKMIFFQQPYGSALAFSHLFCILEQIEYTVFGDSQE